jgi:hypothetical protein
MKAKFILSSLFVLLCNLSYSQKEFFRSKQSFTPEQLSIFYSSISLHGDQLLFIANDYNLYAYKRSTGEQQWVSSLGYKTTRQCFVADGLIYAPYHIDKQERTAMLDSATGKLIRLLPLGPLETKPIMRNGILYGTAIYDKGVLFAYDVKADSLLWNRFVAHGVSEQPYYFANYIQANAEAYNWIRVNYQGQLMDTTCKTRASIFVEDIPCIRVFNALTHDGYELDEKFSEKIFADKEAITIDNTLKGLRQTFVLKDDKLIIIGNKKKLEKTVELTSLFPDTAGERSNGLDQLLLATENTLSLIYKEELLVYDHRKHKLETTIDLSGWQPSQVLPDGNKIWLISRKDGLLYGISF